MSDFINFYQYLPFRMIPGVSLGVFFISWYSVMYLVAFATVYLLVKYRVRKGEWTNEPKVSARNPELSEELLINFLLYAFVGLIVGARLGEVLFYNFSYYMASPIQIISPFDPVTHKFIGIYGMSYHGGLIGTVISAWMWARKNSISLLNWVDFVIPAVPAGYFFGRLGNFINGELYGRATQKWWGMYFPGDSLQMLRHPSQLYEAFFEGIVLFFVLWMLRNKKWARGEMLALYLGGYALVRISIEFFREPEKPSDVFLGMITTGQLLSLGMLLAASFIFWKNRKNLV